MLRRLLMVAALLPLLGVPGAAAGLVLAGFGLAVVWLRPDLPGRPLWFGLAALPILLCLAFLVGAALNA